MIHACLCYVLSVPDFGPMSGKSDAVYVIMLYALCSGVSPTYVSRYAMYYVFGVSPMYASLCVICSGLRSDVGRARCSICDYVICYVFRCKPNVGASPM